MRCARQAAWCGHRACARAGPAWAASVARAEVAGGGKERETGGEGDERKGGKKDKGQGMQTAIGRKSGRAGQSARTECTVHATCMYILLFTLQLDIHTFTHIYTQTSKRTNVSQRVGWQIVKRHNDNCQRLCSVASCLKTHLTLSPLSLPSPSFPHSLCSPAGHSVYQLAVMMVLIFVRRGDLQSREAGGSARTVPTPPSTTRGNNSFVLMQIFNEINAQRNTTSSTCFPRLLQQLDLPGHSLWHTRKTGHHHRVWRPGLKTRALQAHKMAGLLCECCKFLFSVYSTKKNHMNTQAWT